MAYTGMRVDFSNGKKNDVENLFFMRESFFYQKDVRHEILSNNGKENCTNWHMNIVCTKRISKLQNFNYFHKKKTDEKHYT